ncbi:MAG: hypothetical protein O3C43_24510 [Verrucomicrobia bacterium]|nr:hypothetical protein [Verrucomicrobiota bacterium]
MPGKLGIEGHKKKLQSNISDGYHYEILEYVADQEKVYLMGRVAEPWPGFAVPSETKKTHSLKIHHELVLIKDGKISKFEFTPYREDQFKELSGFQGSFEKMVEALSSK